MNRNLYVATKVAGKDDDIRPTGDVDLFKALRKMEDEASLAQAEHEGLHGRAAESKKRWEGKQSRVHRTLNARNRGRKFYRLKSGEITDEPPDKQLELASKGKGKKVTVQAPLPGTVGNSNGDGEPATAAKPETATK